MSSPLEQAWYRGAWWLWLLRPVELFYRLMSGLRRWVYHGGLMRSYRAPVPVVVVGNITVGGTGKTPVVIALVERLQREGLRPGVVSRGYGASADHYPYSVGEGSTARDCGDEPLLIYRRTGCPVVVDPRRAVAVQKLLHAGDVDIVLSDDGLQHYALARDMEIALVDQQRQLGNGFCLPAGPLREPAGRLRQVDVVLYRGAEDIDCGVRYQPEALIAMGSDEQRAFDSARLGPQVYAVAGIGQPQQFFSSLEDAGFKIETRIFPDHHQYSDADFSELVGKPLIMTEKDAVKCQGLVGPDAWYLRIDAQLPAAVETAVVELARSKL